ncbi:MAG: UDP-glucose/GDP-mannose dehydrogenase family protein [Parcubacteria group bacterium]|nr:UDP-glucose/GDP-mannose dehydrogenase family protein [Parcubacteria group bacterium]
MRKYRIGVIGVGMVGTPLKEYFESKGYRRGTDLFCYDKDSRKKCADDINKAEVIFVAVPTPRRPKDGRCDTSILEEAVRMIQGEKAVVIKSTVPPGTAERLQEKHPQHKFMFNPEFLTESQAKSDFLNPDRQIVATTEKSKGIASDVLMLLPIASFSSPGALTTYDYIFIRATSAELGKLATNSFGMTKVMFANILADICDGVNGAYGRDIASYEEVKHVIGHDKRIGPYWLDVYHGNYRGAGGYCFPKDFDNVITSMSDTIAKLKRKNGDKKLIERLERGRSVFKAFWDYNITLLRHQGLSLHDVSRHDKDVQEVVKKKKRN